MKCTAFGCHHLGNYNWRGSLGLIAATSLSLAFTGLLLLLLGEGQFGLLEFALGHRLCPITCAQWLKQLCYSSHALVMPELVFPLLILTAVCIYKCLHTFLPGAASDCAFLPLLAKYTYLPDMNKGYYMFFGQLCMFCIQGKKY